MIRRLFLGAGALLVLTADADAQVYSISEPRARGIYVHGAAESPLTVLARLHKAGDRLAFEAGALALLEKARKADAALPAHLSARLSDYLGHAERDYYNIVWPGTGADGKPTVHRVLVRRGMAPQHATRILGVEHTTVERRTDEPRVYDVLLADDQTATLHSVWVFTPGENPLIAQIPAVVGKIDPLKVIGAWAGTANIAAAIRIEIREPRMLTKRAKIEVRDAITTQPPAGGVETVATGTTALSNIPLTRMSFGVMTGLMVGRPSMDEPRVSVQNGVIAKAPIERAMTMVVLNMHPRAYDADWPDVTWAERLRFFAGAVLTPDFGLTAGAGIGVVRGLSLNAGGVLLFSNTLKDGETIGEKPIDGNDPFKAGRNLSGFIGLSYAFK